MAPLLSGKFGFGVPFLHMLKVTLRDLQLKLRAREQRQRGDTDRDLLSADEAGYYNRTVDEQTQHEDDTRRAASKPSYYSCHVVPIEHLPRLTRAEPACAEDEVVLVEGLRDVHRDEFGEMQVLVTMHRILYEGSH